MSQVIKCGLKLEESEGSVGKDFKPAGYPQIFFKGKRMYITRKGKRYLSISHTLQRDNKKTDPGITFGIKI